MDLPQPTAPSSSRSQKNHFEKRLHDWCLSARYFASPKAGQDVVTDHEGEPVRNLARLSHARAAEMPNENDLSPADFKAAVRNRLQLNQRAQ